MLTKKDIFYSGWMREEIWDWLSEHDQAFKDCLNVFGYELDNKDKYLEVEAEDFINKTETTLDDLLGWIAEHRQLAEDFEDAFDISLGKED